MANQERAHEYLLAAIQRFVRVAHGYCVTTLGPSNCAYSPAPALWRSSRCARHPAILGRWIRCCGRSSGCDSQAARGSPISVIPYDKISKPHKRAGIASPNKTLAHSKPPEKPAEKRRDVPKCVNTSSQEMRPWRRLSTRTRKDGATLGTRTHSFQAPALAGASVHSWARAPPPPPAHTHVLRYETAMLQGHERTIQLR